MQRIAEWIQFSFDMYILWIIVLLVVKSRWYVLGKDGLRDIAHITHYRQQCTFFKPVYFLASRTRNFRLFLAHFFANLRTFWYTSTGLNNVVVYQNLQISGVPLDKLSTFIIKTTDLELLVKTKSSKSVGLHCKTSPILMISGSPSAFCSSRSKIPRSKRTFISVTWTLLESISKGAITNISNLAFAFCCTPWWSQWLNWRKLPWCPLDFEHFTFYV